MDPLSPVASVIAVIAATQTALKFVLATYGARSELCALSNELNDLIVVLQEINNVAEEHAEACSSAALLQILDSTVSQLDELRRKVDEWKAFSKEKWSGCKQMRWLRIAPKVKSFRGEFRNLRFQVTAVLSASSV